MEDALTQLIDRLDKVYVLACRGATDGERMAASAAVDRLRASLLQFRMAARDQDTHDRHNFEFAITSLAQLRIVCVLVTERGGNIREIDRANRRLHASLPRKGDEAVIRALAGWYCSELDSQLQKLAREFVATTAQSDLPHIDTHNDESTVLTWRLASRHERNVFGSILLRLGLRAFRNAWDPKSTIKVCVRDNSEASLLRNLLNDAIKQFRRAMINVNCEYLENIGILKHG